MRTKAKFSIIVSTAILLLVVCLTFLIGCTPFKSAPQGISEDTRTFTKIADKRMYAEAEDYKGYVYKNGNDAFCFRLKSPEIKEDKQYPLVVFLHGMGDWGTDNSAHMYKSLIDSVKNYAPEECFVFMPQAIKDYDWSNDGKMVKKAGMDKLYNECLDLLLEQYPIDKTRVYLTGMSMGGHGTVWQATQHPQKYAAIMPVCGYFYNKKTGIMFDNLDKIANKPMWFFHSRNDGTVPFDNSTRLIAELNTLGATDIKTRWFDEPLHDITALAYDSRDVWEWLFAQKLNNCFNNI